MNWTNIRKWAVDYLWWYATRRGVLSLAIMAAALIGNLPSIGLGLLPAACIAGIGSIIITTYDRLVTHRAYENTMLDLYRNEIAADLGRDPNSLTRADLQEAGKTNEVLHQALKRQEQKTAVAMITELLAAVVTVALVWGVDAVGLLKKAVEAGAGATVGNAVATVYDYSIGKIAAMLVGVGTVSGISSMIFQDGVERLIGKTTSLGKAAAHDQIITIKQGLEEGKSATPEQVYGVLVAGDAKLAASITKQFHRPYEKLNPQQQHVVLEKIGVTECVTALTEEINSGKMGPGKLAYLIGEERYMQRKVHAIEEKAHEPICQKFVERLGRAAHNAHEHLSHRERVDASRVAAAEKAVG